MHDLKLSLAANGRAHKALKAAGYKTRSLIGTSYDFNTANFVQAFKIAGVDVKRDYVHLHAGTLDVEEHHEGKSTVILRHDTTAGRIILTGVIDTDRLLRF